MQNQIITYDPNPKSVYPMSWSLLSLNLFIFILSNYMMLTLHATIFYSSIHR